MRRKPTPARALVVAALFAGAAHPAHGFLGFADTSFVTVIANPAEAANWAAELQRLNEQLAAATGTLKTVGDLRSYAGDPRKAVGAVGDLGQITQELGALSNGAQTASDLLDSWQNVGAEARQAGASALLQRAGANSTMQVFGRALERDPSLYGELAKGDDASQRVRRQIASEQAARTLVASELAAAWTEFKAATTESGKQAILAEISQLQSQNQIMDTRRRAMLDDLELSDRQGQAEASVRSKARDEQLLAESALLNGDAATRARGSEAQRQATLGKQAPARPEPDYSGLKLWTTADTAGAPP